MKAPTRSATNVAVVLGEILRRLQSLCHVLRAHGVEKAPDPEAEVDIARYTSLDDAC